MPCKFWRMYVTLILFSRAPELHQWIKTIMSTKKKSLIDDHDGQFILNESGTSVFVDKLDDANGTGNQDEVNRLNETREKQQNDLTGKPALKDTAAEPKDNTD